MSIFRHTAADEPFFLVRTLAAQMTQGRSTGRHAHPWGQLIYCSAGVMTVWTPEGSWVAPPRWAIWVPAGVAHDIRFAGEASLRTLYLRADVAARLPAECAVMTVSPLLRELIARAMDAGMLDERDAAHRAMALLITTELERRDAGPLDLPSPQSAATRRAADLLAAGAETRAGALAAEVGLGARTLERRFLTETGLSLAAWGRQARLLQALRLLAAGAPVKSVAGDAGYRTPSAFVAAFAATFGTTPGQYFGGAKPRG